MSLLAITNAGVLYKDAVFAGEEVQNITRVIFRNIAGLVPETAIDLAQGVPSTDIVHTNPIERVAALDGNTVVMSTVLGYDIGDFQYNWYGVIAQKADLSEVLIAVVQTPVQTKTKTEGATTGNYSTKSIVWKTANIAMTLNVTLSALPWQMADNTFVTQAAYDLAMAEKLDKNATADNALKLGNQLPDYYAKQSVVDTIANFIDSLSVENVAGLVNALAGKLGSGDKSADSFKLGGKVGSTIQTASTVAIRDANGNLKANGIICIGNGATNTIPSGCELAVRTNPGAPLVFHGKALLKIFLGVEDKIIHGSNANGYYIKYPNGTLICSNRIFTDSANNYKHQLFAFKFETMSNIRMVCSGQHNTRHMMGASVMSVTACYLSARRASDNLITNAVLNYFAIGTWK